MGVKAMASLRLVTAPKHTGYLSYRFDRLEQMLAAQVRIARLGIASECYGFDPYYNGGFEKQGITFEEGLSKVGEIARKGGLKGVMNAAKVALGGKRILRDVPYSLHMTLDGLTERVARRWPIPFPSSSAARPSAACARSCSDRTGKYGSRCMATSPCHAPSRPRSAPRSSLLSAAP
jgi:hypothetical protein